MRGLGHLEAAADGRTLAVVSDPQVHVVAAGDLGQKLQVRGPLVQRLPRLLVDPRRVLDVQLVERLAQDLVRRVGGPPGPGRLHADAVQQVAPVQAVDLEPRARTTDDHLALVLDDRTAHEAGQCVAHLDDHGHDGIDRQAVVVGVAQAPVLEVVQEAQGELDRLVQLLLDASLDDAAGQILVQRRVVLADADDRAETHGAPPYVLRGMRTTATSARASGRTASLCSAMRQKPKASCR